MKFIACSFNLNLFQCYNYCSVLTLKFICKLSLGTRAVPQGCSQYLRHSLRIMCRIPSKRGGRILSMKVEQNVVVKVVVVPFLYGHAYSFNASLLVFIGCSVVDGHYANIFVNNGVG